MANNKNDYMANNNNNNNNDYMYDDGKCPMTPDMTRSAMASAMASVGLSSGAGSKTPGKNTIGCYAASRRLESVP
jgi:hypothetical protein